MHKVLRDLKQFYKTFKLEKIRYRLSLMNVTYDDPDKIKLFVIVQGIKKQILTYQPEEIVWDDALLSEFSPCDVRTITYLLFHKYISYNELSFAIEKQIMKNGETIFKLKSNDNNSLEISAQKLYQNYDLLSKLHKKDMVVAIATAVQEQALSDINKMVSIDEL